MRARSKTQGARSTSPSMTNDAMGTTVPSVVDLRGLDLDLSIHDMLVWNGAEAAYCYRNGIPAKVNDMVWYRTIYKISKIQKLEY